jgi:hypothetical protein
MNILTDLKIRGSWGKMGNQFALAPQNAVYIFYTRDKRARIFEYEKTTPWGSNMYYWATVVP